MIPAYFGEKKGEKEGGVHHNTDPVCGVYDNGDDKFLIKRDEGHPERDIAEFLTSRMFNIISPGSACVIHLAKDRGNTNNTYLASKFFKDNYQDLSNAMGVGKRGKFQRAREASLYRIPGMNAVTEELRNKSYGHSYADSIVPSMLFEDKSVHSGNIGVIVTDTYEKRIDFGSASISEGQESIVRGKDAKLVRIDFGSAFRSEGKLESVVDPYKDVTEANGIFSKNYLLKDHPPEKTLEAGFIQKLKKTSQTDLSQSIDHTWAEITGNFEMDEIKKFGKQIAKNQDFLTDGNFNPDSLKQHFTQIMQDRQKSLKDMATQLELVNALKDPEADRGKIIRGIQKDNPKYFERLETGKDPLVQVHPSYHKDLAKAIDIAKSLPKEVTMPSTQYQTKRRLGVSISAQDISAVRKAIKSFEIVGPPDTGSIDLSKAFLTDVSIDRVSKTISADDISAVREAIKSFEIVGPPDTGSIDLSKTALTDVRMEIGGKGMTSKGLELSIRAEIDEQTIEGERYNHLKRTKAERHLQGIELDPQNIEGERYNHLKRTKAARHLLGIELDPKNIEGERYNHLKRTKAARHLLGLAEHGQTRPRATPSSILSKRGQGFSRSE